MTQFALAKPMLGSRSGEVDVGDREITIRHPLLKGALQLPIAGIAGATAGPDVEDDQVLARPTRQLTFASTAFDEPTVTLVLADPVLVIGFKRGADRFFDITASERRGGVEIDAVGLGVEDEEGFLAELRARGVRTDRSGGQLLAQEIGLATPDQVDEHRRRGRRAGLTAGAYAGVLMLLTTALISWGIAALGADGDDVELGAVVAIALSSLGWTVCIAGAIVAWPASPAPSSVDERNVRRRRRMLAVMLLTLVVPGVLFAVLVSDAGDSDAARIILGGLVTGFMNGLLIGIVVRAVRRRRREPAGPISPPR